MADTATFEPLRDRGRLLAFANIETGDRGRAPEGSRHWCCAGARWKGDLRGAALRYLDGRWLPAVVLPKELTTAISTEVLATFDQGLGTSRFTLLLSDRDRG